MTLLEEVVEQCVRMRDEAGAKTALQLTLRAREYDVLREELMHGGVPHTSLHRRLRGPDTMIIAGVPVERFAE